MPNLTYKINPFLGYAEKGGNTHGQLNIVFFYDKQFSAFSVGVCAFLQLYHHQRRIIPVSRLLLKFLASNLL